MRPWSKIGWLLLLLACRDSAFDAASKTDTFEGYQAFVREHPDDQNVEVARARLAELEFARARQTHTVVAYKRFLEQYPDAPKASAAQALLEGLRFNATQTRETAAAWRQFLKDHPDGAHREEAEKRLAAAELREVVDLSDQTELNRYVAAYGDDARGAKAAARLDEQHFAAASTARELYAYLREYPAGGHRDEARVRLLSLQLDGLLASGRLAEAKALAAKSPLASRVAGLDVRFKNAASLEATSRSADEATRRALPSYYLRSLDDLVKSLQAPDPMDRWQAAEELGAVVDVKAIDPLLEALRVSPIALVRQRAFESLHRLLAALPNPVAEYEVATRVEALRANASDQRMVLSMAALLDASSALDKAAPEYQRAFDPQAPDPVVLRRWSAVRLERKQGFSAAVAARQLALWAESEASATDPTVSTGMLSVARHLCGAAEAAREAQEVIAQARKQPLEFGDDVAQFELKTQQIVRLVEAKLRDAELKLLEGTPSARRCGDDAVAARLADAERARVAAIQKVKAKAPSSLLLKLAQERDPSPAVRAAAAVAVAP